MKQCDKTCMRAEIYQQNDPTDYSMLTQPKLKINDVVIVWDKEEGGEWVQARVVDATFHRHDKAWGYSAVTEFVDCPTLNIDRPESILLKQWYCFSDDELHKAQPYTNIDMYIVTPKQCKSL